MEPPSKAATMPPSAGAGRVENFRLRGSRPCRRMGVPLSDGGWRMQVVHAFGNHKTALSEGVVLAAVVETLPGNPHWTRVGTDSSNPVRKSAVGRRLRISPPRPARPRAAREGVMVEGATPLF